jgi:pentatricopeptide repeat protein
LRVYGERRESERVKERDDFEMKMKPRPRGLLPIRRVSSGDVLLAHSALCARPAFLPRPPQVLGELRNSGQQAGSNTYTNFIDAAGKAGDVDQALDLIQALKEDGGYGYGAPLLHAPLPLCSPPPHTHTYTHTRTASAIRGVTLSHTSMIHQCRYCTASAIRGGTLSRTSMIHQCRYFRYFRDPSMHQAQRGPRARPSACHP